VSILKSPLTIFGILLIIVAGVLGLAPYFVNWNEHKAEFQRQASLLTGRTVTIDGQISVRLFPWPSLTADNVRISNPPGSLLQDFAQVERVEAEIAAPALLSGQIEFRKVRLLRPVLALERLASGGTSWNINPARSLKGLPGADQIAVAMAARGYSGRTTPLAFTTRPRDWMLLAVALTPAAIHLFWQPA